MEADKKKLIYGTMGFLSFIILLSIFVHFNHKYIVTFDSYGGSLIKEKKIKMGKILGEIDIPIKEGYEFLYWTTNGEKVDENYIIKKDITLVAYYRLKEEKTKYKIVFDTDGGSNIEAIEIEENKTATMPDDPIKEGFVFKEWQLDNKTFDFNTVITEDITLKATYEKDNRKIYTVVFDTDGGSKISSKSVKEGEAVSRPNNPTKVGYTFKEWKLNGATYKFNTKITSNITLKAIYTKDEVKVETKEYTVVFDTDGGSAITSQTVEGNKTVSKPSNPTKTGYTFKEWQLEGKTYDFNTKVTKAITLKAIYTKDQEKPQTIAVDKVTLDKTSYSLKVDEKVTLTVTVTPTNATNKTITWTSSDNSIATVSNGVVTAIKAGTVTITATVDGKKATSTIVIANNITYDYEIVDISGSTTGQCYIYIKSSEGNHVSGSLTVTYKNGASETIQIPTSGYMWPSRSVIASISNVKVS